MMRAGVGARIVVCGHRAGWPDRECEVVQVRSASGGPPCLVRWSESGRETIPFPGPDAVIGNDDRERSERVDPFAWPDRYGWGYC
jgi:hypothetical protein